MPLIRTRVSSNCFSRRSYRSVGRSFLPSRLADASNSSWHLVPAVYVLQRRPKCSHSEAKTDGHPNVTAHTLPLSSLQFWSSTSAWKRAAVNTSRCLVGCTSGDFAAMWYLQAFHPEIGMSTIMAIAMASGITTSMLLETTLLRFGRDRLPWPAAAKTAAGMSLISMVTMEMAENAVDYQLTGGVVQFDSPAFWGAALLSISAGFLAPLPYNYLRLKRYGKACH